MKRVIKDADTRNIIVDCTIRLLFSGSYSLNLGLQYENAAMMALIRNIDIAIAYLFDVVVLRHSFSVMSLTGSTLVVMATIGSGFINATHRERSTKIFYNKVEQIE